MRTKAPIISKISFTCGECEKKQSVKVDVVDFLGKNHFSFKCKKCRASWIVYFYEATVARPLKTKIVNLRRYLVTREPQPVRIGNLTFELQPLNVNEIVDPDQFGTIKIGDITCGLQPMNEITLVGSDRLSQAERNRRSNSAKVFGVKGGLAVRDLPKNGKLK